MDPEATYSSTTLNSGDNLTFIGSQQIAVAHGGTLYFHNNDANITPAFKELIERTVPEAFHNTNEPSDAPKCHPGTRVAILRSLEDWASQTAYEYPIRWLSGPAGAGKSAIARSIAQTLFELGLLMASFFFFRTSSRRNTANFLIPSLAYQLCRQIPVCRPFIERSVAADPLLFSQSLSSQIQILIINPIAEAYKKGAIPANYPRVIIIDGLDECAGSSTQCEILQILNDMLSKLPIPIAILVVSRPKPHIRGAFDSKEINHRSSRLTLDESFEPDEDTRRFYIDKFNHICTHHPLRSSLPPIWPLPSVIEILVVKASGQFIFASTVIKFVEPDRHHPDKRLKIILGSISPGNLKPFEPLDLLYAGILHSVPDDDLKDTLRVLGALLLPRVDSKYDHKYRDNMVGSRQEHLSSTSCPAFLEQLLGLSQGDVRRLFFDLESLLKINHHSDSDDIQVFHASLGDFFFDKSRSGELGISPELVHEDLAKCCLRSTCLNRSASSLDVKRVEMLMFYVLQRLDWHIELALLTPSLIDALRRYGPQDLLDFALQFGDNDITLSSQTVMASRRALQLTIPRVLRCLKLDHTNSEVLLHWQASSRAILHKILFPLYVENFSLLLVLYCALNPLYYVNDLRIRVTKHIPEPLLDLERKGLDLFVPVNIYRLSYRDRPLVRLIPPMKDVLYDGLKTAIGSDPDSYICLRILHQALISRSPETTSSQVKFGLALTPLLLSPECSPQDDLLRFLRKHHHSAMLQSQRDVKGTVDDYLLRAESMNPSQILPPFREEHIHGHHPLVLDDHHYLHASFNGSPSQVAQNTDGVSPPVVDQNVHKEINALRQEMTAIRQIQQTQEDESDDNHPLASVHHYSDNSDDRHSRKRDKIVKKLRSLF